MKVLRVKCRMPSIFCSIGILTLILTLQSSGAVAQTVCEGQTGKALGLCNAYCEAMDCDGDTPNAAAEACSSVRTNFEAVSGGAPPPCDGVGPPPDATCPCNFSAALWAADGFYRPNVDRDLVADGECFLASGTPFFDAFVIDERINQDAILRTFVTLRYDGFQCEAQIAVVALSNDESGLNDGAVSRNIYSELKIVDDFALGALCRADFEAVVAELGLACIAP